MHHIEDSVIIDLLKDTATQRKGFELIVQKYSSMLYWQIRHIVLSHDDSNDVLQNTFIKAWIGLNNFRADSKLSTWLYRIAVNESITFIHKRKENLSLDDEDNNAANSLESDPWFDGDETDLKLQKAIQTLPEKQRIVFNMKYFQDMKYEDMSQILGTSVGALKASYHFAVEKIEEYFKYNE